MHINVISEAQYMDFISYLSEGDYQSKTLIVEFDGQDGIVVPDCKTEKAAEEIVREYNESIYGIRVKVGSELMVNQMRVQVKRGTVNRSDVLMIICGNPSLVSERFQIEWKGSPDVLLGVLRELSTRR